MARRGLEFVEVGARHKAHVCPEILGDVLLLNAPVPSNRLVLEMGGNYGSLFFGVWAKRLQEHHLSVVLIVF